MNMKGVEIGQKVELVQRRESGETVFQSSIADFGGGIVLLMPLVSKGVRQRLAAKGAYTLVITTRQGIFRVEVEFVGEKREQNGVFPAFRLTNQKQKIQRRNHCRLTKILQASLAPDQNAGGQPKGEPWDQDQEVPFYDLTILDLSAGGLRISSKEELDRDSLYDISFSLPDEKHTQVQCKGAVVWHSWNETMKMHQYGIQFLVIQQGVQDRIFQYIFQQQASEARLG